MYKLYSLAGSCSTAITVLLTKLNIKFEVIQRGDVENYQKIVATNQVPALEHDGVILTEGAAIVLYVLEKHDNDMMPKDLTKKYEFIQQLMFNYSTLHPAYSKLFAVAGNMHDSEEKSVLMQKLGDAISKNWAILNDRLSKNKYIFGSSPTIIDYLAVIYTSWGNYFPNVKIDFGSNIEKLVKEIAILPEFKDSYELEGISFKSKLA